MVNQQNLSSEEKLIIYSARTNMNEDLTKIAREILNDNLDWDYILKSSIRHDIHPLLYWNMKKIENGNSVPEEIFSKLKTLYYGSAARNMFMYDELGTVLKALKNAGINVIVLKGGCLGETVYKNIGLRPMRDVDLLIKKGDLHKVKKELAQLEFDIPAHPTKLHEKLYEQELTEESNEIQYNKQDKKIRVDIHWNIQDPSSPFQIDINEFWENAQSVRITGVDTLMLSPEDLLLHLCLHLDRHLSNLGAVKLKNFCDIAEVLRHFEGTINWEYFMRMSRKYGVEEPIYKGLFYANKYLEAPVPPYVFNDLNPVETSADFKGIFIRTRTIESDLKTKIQWKEIKYFKRLKKVDGIWNKGKILFGDIFPCKEFMMQRYQMKNITLIYIYYPIRFVNALYWGINTLWQLPVYSFKSKTK